MKIFYIKPSVSPDIDARLIGLVDFQQPPSGKKPPAPRRVKRRMKKLKERRFRPSGSAEASSDYQTEQMFLCLKCRQETKLARNFVVNHLRKHRLSLQEYLDKFDTPDNQSRLASVRLWVQKEEYLSKISGRRGGGQYFNI